MKQDAYGIFGIVGSDLVAFDRNGLRTSLVSNAALRVNQFAPHHDIDCLRNGDFLVLVLKQRDGYRVDMLYEVNPKTQQIAWSWDVNEHLLGSDATAKNIDVRGESWIHDNSIDVYPNGDILLSARNLNEPVQINRSTGKVMWRRGADVLSLQHDATLQPDGSILVFNNGAKDKESSVVRFTAEGRVALNLKLGWYANSFGGVDRMPNGDWLLIDGTRGIIYEYDPPLKHIVRELQLARLNYVGWAQVAHSRLRRFLYRAIYVPTLPFDAAVSQVPGSSR